MALNPYTLYNLYEKGILDYVPTDLIGVSPMAAMTSMNNPYLDAAKQGGLYQNSGYNTDSFQFSGVQSPYVQNYQTYGNVGNSSVQVGSKSNAGGINTFNGYGVGAQSQVNTAGTFGINGVNGAYSNAGGMNTFNGYGVGTQYNRNVSDMFGEFNDTQNNLTNGFNKTISVINNTPKLILGVIGCAIGIIGLKAAFRRAPKPSATTSNKSFLSKLNPLNWFKKK